MPAVSEPLADAVFERVRECIDTANHQLGIQLTYPDTSLSLRGRAAGTAHPSQWRLRFNPVLLQQSPHVFFEEVIPHEVCHLVTFALYGRVKPHGSQWRTLMETVFQAPANTTHQLDITAVKGKTFAYACHCGEVALTVRRHNKVQRGEASYRCKRCHQTLMPVSAVL